MHNPERINVYEMVIEKPEKKSELPFEPEKEITSADWEGMKKDLKREKDSEQWFHIYHHAMNMKLLDKQYNLGISQADLQGMRRELDFLRTF